MVNNATRRTHYEELEVAPRATPSDISKAFRRLATQYHPDMVQQKTSDPTRQKEMEARYKRISEAYNVLHDPVKRQRYDAELNYYGSGTGGATTFMSNAEQMRTWVADYEAFIDQTYKINQELREHHAALRYSMWFSAAKGLLATSTVVAYLVTAILVILLAWRSVWLGSPLYVVLATAAHPTDSAIPVLSAIMTAALLTVPWIIAALVIHNRQKRWGPLAGRYGYLLEARKELAAFREALLAMGALLGLLLGHLLF